MLAGDPLSKPVSAAAAPPPPRSLIGLLEAAGQGQVVGRVAPVVERHVRAAAGRAVAGDLVEPPGVGRQARSGQAGGEVGLWFPTAARKQSNNNYEWPATKQSSSWWGPQSKQLSARLTPRARKASPPPPPRTPSPPMPPAPTTQAPGGARARYQTVGHSLWWGPLVKRLSQATGAAPGH